MQESKRDTCRIFVTVQPCRISACCICAGSCNTRCNGMERYNQPLCYVLTRTHTGRVSDVNSFSTANKCKDAGDK